VNKLYSTFIHLKQFPNVINKDTAMPIATGIIPRTPLNTTLADLYIVFGR